MIVLIKFDDLTFNYLEICVPYTKTACLRASKQSNMQIGDDEHNFIGDYPIKGCHSKADRVFFGISSNIIDHQMSLVDPYFRPNGYDCGIKDIIEKIKI